MKDFLRDAKKKRTFVYGFAVLSVFFFLLARLVAEKPIAAKDAMIRAARLMREATGAVRRCREDRGLIIDTRTDPNATGLIGLDTSPITTSLGNLEAKRTTTNPNFAGLLVRLLSEAGAQRGDAIAIGASSSFPALILASLCAAEALGLEPLLICSLGASQWGANNPDFHWLDIQECLSRAGLLDINPLALSLGGEADSGEDMSPEGWDFLSGEARRRGFALLEAADLPRNVEERIRLYARAADEKEIKVFINIGGSHANLGTDSRILNVKPGLAEFRDFPPPERRGVVFEMAARGIPVIHLLYIKGLAERYGLPWDQSPLPEPGEGDIYKTKELSRRPFFLITFIYFVLAGLFFFLLILRR
ncbi:MAG: poly-gamma-glutamate system protein [Candidatus Aminicenantes bacterium]|nr:poly-gamma-glutamate system protein [Candidatus Aminicenantes bacterium]